MIGSTGIIPEDSPRTQMARGQTSYRASTQANRSMFFNGTNAT